MFVWTPGCIFGVNAFFAVLREILLLSSFLLTRKYSKNPPRGTPDPGIEPTATMSTKESVLVNILDPKELRMHNNYDNKWKKTYYGRHDLQLYVQLQIQTE